MFLKDKKDLGIHTEMISDRIVDLVKAGVVTGEYKTLDLGKVVASFCLGSRKLYDFIDDNPTFSFQPTEYVNDPFIISRQKRMVAINVALEVDLIGQVCADSIGRRFFSGVGGQVDFIRGAARSEGGKSIIALPSTARGGRVSRIVSRLTPGAGVVTTRADVHYVATEYGIDYLHGKSIQERAIALICIAHPDFRAKLLKEAIKARYLSVELSDRGNRIIVGPSHMRIAYSLKDGTRISFRPIHPTDEPKMRHLFYALSEQTIYYRFMCHRKRMPHRQLEDLVYVDHRNEVTIVGTIHTGSLGRRDRLSRRLLPGSKNEPCRSRLHRPRRLAEQGDRVFSFAAPDPDRQALRDLRLHCRGIGAEQSHAEGLPEVPTRATQKDERRRGQPGVRFLTSALNRSNSSSIRLPFSRCILSE